MGGVSSSRGRDYELFPFPRDEASPNAVALYMNVVNNTGKYLKVLFSKLIARPHLMTH